MATNLDIDNELIVKAQKAGKHKTKKETVISALVEYIEKREQKKIKKNFLVRLSTMKTIPIKPIGLANENFG